VGDFDQTGAGTTGFQDRLASVSPRLLDNGYGELPIISDHVVAIDMLPVIPKDPFDRILISQAMVEGITLLTTDSLLMQYPGPIRNV
jgi:PIN domain nuclease of toxin-antitoxin system